MQVIRLAIALASALPAIAHAQAPAAEASVEGEAEPSPDLVIKLTLSSFVFRQAGDAAPPLDGGDAAIESASPVRRYFGDLRLELEDGSIAFDGRVRQTTSARYQSGAAGGSEYDIRTLRYQLGTPRTQLVLGRQFVDAVGATKLDGAAVIQRLGKTWSGTLFGGAYPALGSRSLASDYPAIVNPDGTTGARLVPIAGGIGAGYHRPNVHGSVGLAAIYVAQDVPQAASNEASRVFTTANGYARPASWLDLYHFALLDIAGGTGTNLTNGSVGLNLHPTENVQLSTSLNHVSTDQLQIAARNNLADPDPTAMGIVQNDIAIIRVSQDVARVATSVGLARSRFEVSIAGSYHRRPGVEVALVDGERVTFPEARSAEASLTILDRKSIGGLRASAGMTLTFPLADDAPARSRGTIVRLVAGRAFHEGRAELTGDVMIARFAGATSAGSCMDSLDVLRCFSASRTATAQAGVLGSYAVAREWLFLLDTHVGVQDVASATIMGEVRYPRVLSVSVFARAQWRYH